MIPLLLIVLLLSGTWLTAPLWLSKTVEYILTDQQCSEAVVDLESVGWNSSQINRLYCKDRQGSLEIDLTDAVVHYRFSELLEKRIGHIKLDSIAIQLRPSLESTSKAAPLLTTPALILEALPLSSFEIKHISLQRQNQSREILQELSGKARYSAQGLSLELHEESYLQGLQVSVDLDKKNGIRTTIQQGDRSILKADSTMHKTADGILIKGIADIELAPLSAALKPWLKLPDQQLKGRLHSAWQVSLPVQSNKPLMQQLDVSSTFTLDFSLNRPDLGPSQGHVNLGLTYKQGLGRWTIAEQSLLSFGDKQKTTVDISKLSGSFGVAESGWHASIADKSELHLINIHIDDIFMPALQLKTETAVEFTGGSKEGIQLVEKAAMTVVLPLLQVHKKTDIEVVRINLTLHKSNRVIAELYQGRKLLLKTAASMRKTDSATSVDGEADFKLGPLSTLLKPWINMAEYKLAGDLYSRWKFSLPRQPEAVKRPLLQQLKASAACTLDVALKAPNLTSSRGTVQLNLEYDQGEGSWALAKGSQFSVGQKPKMKVSLSKLSGSFRHVDPGWQFFVAKNSHLQVNNMLSNEISIPYFQMNVSAPVKVSLNSKKGMKMLQRAKLRVVLPSVQWQQNNLLSREVTLTIDRGSVLSPSGSFTASGVNYISPAVKLPKMSVSGRYKLSAKKISVTGEMDAHDVAVRLNWKLKHHFIRQSGLLDFTFKPLLFGEAGIDLSKIVDGQAEYAIDDGVVDFNGLVQWQKAEGEEKLKLKPLFNLGLSNLKGHYKTNQFAGLNGKLFITGDEEKLIVAPSALSLESLSAGVPINHISMNVALSYPLQGLPALEINQFRAEALGGLISSQQISIDLARASNPFVVKLEHMDAGQIANIRQQEGLYVKGMLDGELPFDWGSNGLKMITGELQSTPAGGLIRYQGTESVRQLAATDNATKMVLDIMNNFHYRQLKLGANYMPDGELKVSIKLKGSNPEYEQGRAVEFNFNIEENILQLLQGLRMAGTVSGALEEKVQKTLQQE